MTRKPTLRMKIYQPVNIMIKTKKNNGFTLIELLVTSVIFAVLSLGIYSAFYAGIFGYKSIDGSIKISQTAVEILNIINKDLRNSFAYSNEESKFQGDNKELNFLTISDSYTETGIEQNYAFVGYVLKDKKLMRGCRLNKESFNPNADMNYEEMSSEVESLSFMYAQLDESKKTLQWNEEWNNPVCLPAAVKISIVIKDKHPREFNRTVYLVISGPVADKTS